MSDIRDATPDERTAILAVEAARQAALIDGDLDTLARIFDDRLVHIHAPGVVHDKRMLLEHVGTRRAYLSIERGELAIRVVGDLAIATGPIVNELRNPDGSARTQRGVVTQVLVRDGDDWRFLNFQLTPLGEEVWGKLPSEQAASAAQSANTEEAAR
ncbi:nuclear transport factor 2 family protein [Agromyces larvae]|uniref:Nuclear transport factor 2 family protein n=1 Tax=Agromyces larvae TaxID=2929802 RepID=A0ABY4BVW4_9MICO|nr:nuclear transport factor 2 family protein [Agromyces larvae]UOE43309.1 nuclear transport factor 2 family protein [Agromyces larvae]